MHRNETVQAPAQQFSTRELLEMGHLGRKALPLDKALQNGIWVVTGGCNADCPYCIRSNRSKHEAPEVTNKIVDSLARFPGVWRLSLTGGEVTQVPGFFENIVPRILSETPHMFSISTNLTAEKEKYEQLMAKGGHRFERMSASFHYSIWPKRVQEFLEKVQDMHKMAGQYDLGKFNVACVLAPNALRMIREEINPFLVENNIPVYYQILKVPDATGLPVPFKYNEGQIELLDEIIGNRNRVQALNPGFSFTGRQCKAGVSAILIEPNGDAFTCFDQMEMGESRGYLGNVIKDGPSVLRDNLVVCAAPFCNVGSTVIDRVIDTRSGERRVRPDISVRGLADSMAKTETSTSLTASNGSINFREDLKEYLSSD